VQLAAAEVWACAEAAHGLGLWRCCNIDLDLQNARLQVTQQHVVRSSGGPPAAVGEAHILVAFLSSAATQLMRALAADGTAWSGRQLELTRADAPVGSRNARAADACSRAAATWRVVCAFDSAADESPAAAVHVASAWLPPQRRVREMVEQEARRLVAGTGLEVRAPLFTRGELGRRRAAFRGATVEPRWPASVPNPISVARMTAARVPLATTLRERCIRRVS
jgi:hypothetical protein